MQSRITLPAELPSHTSELPEEALNLLRLCTLLVDIHLRHRRETEKAELPGKLLLVVKDLEDFQREEACLDENKSIYLYT